MFPGGWNSTPRCNSDIPQGTGAPYRRHFRRLRLRSMVATGAGWPIGATAGTANTFGLNTTPAILILLSSPICYLR